ncbi:hypothetical protein O2K51_10845 [Apibacter raozihei]|uniref:hypothetical protein n=2 Tax=Apibacter raozihei TaxID=2500547 RepID=UPI000FE33BD1|nr:hypothetical protein [Apibacter raozihei]
MIFFSCDKYYQNDKKNIDVELLYNEKDSLIVLNINNLSQENYLYMPYFQVGFPNHYQKGSIVNEDLLFISDCQHLFINKLGQYDSRNNPWEEVNMKFDSLVKNLYHKSDLYQEYTQSNQKLVYLINANSKEKLTYKIMRNNVCDEKIKVKIILFNSFHQYKISIKNEQKKLYEKLTKTNFGKYNIYEDKFSGHDFIDIIY